MSYSTSYQCQFLTQRPVWCLSLSKLKNSKLNSKLLFSKLNLSQIKLLVLNFLISKLLYSKLSTFPCVFVSVCQSLSVCRCFPKCSSDYERFLWKLISPTWNQNFNYKFLVTNIVISRNARPPLSCPNLYSSFRDFFIRYFKNLRSVDASTKAPFK